MRLKVLPLVFFLLSFSLLGQIDLQLNFPTPLILLSGAEYSVLIPSDNDSCRYELISDGITIEKTDSSLVMKPLKGSREIYSVELVEIKDEDTSLINRQEFEIMLVPDPLLSLGEFETEYVISCHQDSLAKIEKFELVPSWKTSAV